MYIFGNPDAESSITPAKLKEKLLLWKDCVEREAKKQAQKHDSPAMEDILSHSKSYEITKLRNDLEKTIQEKEVQSVCYSVLLTGL